MKIHQVPPQEGIQSFGVCDAFSLDLPVGWLLREEKRHYQIVDPNEEMKIEFSHHRVPPLRPGAPSVVGRLQIVIDHSKHRYTARPITTFKSHGVTRAWSEYRFDAKNTKRPEDAPRPARGRWFLAANEWNEVFITGCWWDVAADIAIAERAWNDVTGSLELAGRTSQPLKTHGDA